MPENSHKHWFVTLSSIFYLFGQEKSVKARNEEAEQARTQIQKLESELDIHKKANDSLETLTRELSEEKKALALRVQEASADNNTISDLQTELKATKEAIRQATDDLNSSVALLKETKDKLAAGIYSSLS